MEIIIYQQQLLAIWFCQTFYLNFSLSNPIADNIYRGFWLDTDTHFRFEWRSEREKVLKRWIWFVLARILDNAVQSSVVSGRKMQAGSGSSNFRKNRVGSVRVELGNVNIKLLHFLLSALFNTDKSADWTKFRFKTSPLAVNHCSENKMKARFGLGMP